MSSAQKIIQAAAGNAAGEGTYVEDVFSTYLYTGTSSARSIVNNINLAEEGGLVWVKSRGANRNHHLVDTERGASTGSSPGKTLWTNSASGETVNNDIVAFNTDGFNIATADPVNNNNENFVSWTFRKAPKFFDVVTYTGNGVAGRTVSHNLGSEVGCLIVKRTDTTGEWMVWHKDVAAINSDYALQLQSTNAAAGYSTSFNSTAPTSTEFTLGNNSKTNNASGTYVAYLFAHNDDDGEFGENADQDIIKCGSFTDSTTVSVDLGFEPQWLLLKGSGITSNWWIIDNMRGNAYKSTFALAADTSSAESDFGAAGYYAPTATGFANNGFDFFGAGNEVIYIAIRRGPMKTPESGTEVFAIDTKNVGFPSFISGFPVDMGIQTQTTGDSNLIASRLTGPNGLKTDTAAAEDSNSGRTWDYMNGWYDWSGAVSTNISWMFRRSPGFFDVVAYEGTSSATTVSHNLGVTPELILFKSRTLGRDWVVYSKTLTSAYKLSLNEADDGTTVASSYFNGTEPTSTNFTVATNASINQSGANYIAYLFATLPGVSKVGSYTGNGTSQTIDCGFSTGARFVLIKRTDSTGDWHVYDSERGIVAGNDPRLELNTTDAEDTGSDDIDPVSSGFSVTSNADVNTNTAEYIFLAIA